MEIFLVDTRVNFFLISYGLVRSAYKVALTEQQRMCSQVPDHNLAVPGASDYSALVKPDATSDHVRVARKHFGLLACGVVPDAHRVVAAAGQHLREVR